MSVTEDDDADLQFVRYYPNSEKQKEEGLVIARERVGSLEEELSKGCEEREAEKVEWEGYIASLTAQCDRLKKDHGDLTRVALECENRLKQGDERYQKLVESLKKPDHHPKRREVQLYNPKANRKQVIGELDTVKVVNEEKENFFEHSLECQKQLCYG